MRRKKERREREREGERAERREKGKEKIQAITDKIWIDQSSAKYIYGLVHLIANFFRICKVFLEA